MRIQLEYSNSFFKFSPISTNSGGWMWIAANAYKLFEFTNKNILLVAEISMYLKAPTLELTSQCANSQTSVWICELNRISKILWWKLNLWFNYFNSCHRSKVLNIAARKIRPLQNLAGDILVDVQHIHSHTHCFIHCLVIFVPFSCCEMRINKSALLLQFEIQKRWIHCKC